MSPRHPPVSTSSILQKCPTHPSLVMCMLEIKFRFSCSQDITFTHWALSSYSKSRKKEQRQVVRADPPGLQHITMELREAWTSNLFEVWSLNSPPTSLRFWLLMDEVVEITCTIEISCKLQIIWYIEIGCNIFSACVAPSLCLHQNEGKQRKLGCFVLLATKSSLRNIPVS